MSTKNSSPIRNFLFTTWEGGGSVAPAITVARKLRQRGHRVRFMSDRVNHEDAEAAGLDFRAWDAAPSRPDRSPDSCPTRDWEAGSPQEGIMRYFDRIFFGPALEYARDVITELEREPADLVVTSELLSGVMVGCESLGQRFAILAANLCLYPLEGMPTFGPGLPPPRSVEEEALHAEIRQANRDMFDQGLKGVNRARMALGLLPLQSIVEQVNAAERILLGTSRAFDFPVAKLPEKLRYVGAQLDEPAWVKSWASPWPANDTRPLVAVGFSTTYQAHENVLQNIVDATSPLPVRTLVTLGPIAAGAVQPAANTALVSSAPHEAVMRDAAMVVTHGGHGTVMRALRHKRPLLIIPHGRDQAENAVRVTERGAGLSLPASASPGEIQAAIQRLLAEPGFAASARRLGEAIANELGDIGAVEELEELATRTCTSGRMVC